MSVSQRAARLANPKPPAPRTPRRRGPTRHRKLSPIEWETLQHVRHGASSVAAVLAHHSGTYSFHAIIRAVKVLRKRELLTDAGDMLQAVVRPAARA